MTKAFCWLAYGEVQKRERASEIESSQASAYRGHCIELHLVGFDLPTAQIQIPNIGSGILHALGAYHARLA